MYIELGRFTLKVIMNELKKVKRFEKGLRLELYHQVAVFALPAYQTVLEKTQLVETLYKEQIEYSRGTPSYKRILPLSVLMKKR